MHILMCNERFLFRFGVDRVLLIMADYLRAQGDTVTIMGIRIDEKIAKNVADHVILIPPNDDYFYVNEYVDEWLQKRWDQIFSKTGSPDLVLNCGWPFFTAIPFMRKKTKGVIFHDYGIVPTYQYTGGTLKIQEKVRELRRRYMPYSSYVITISDYVTKTTYEIYPQLNIPVKTIHLGVNHMELNLWNKEELESTSEAGNVRNLINQLKENGHALILNLGRWENSGYKNSCVMYEVLRRIRERLPNAVLLTLAKEGDMQIPQDLQGVVYPLGFVADQELVYAMKESDLGIAPTLWEGFNLPLAEMQYYEKPVLVFNLGAHPEVIVHPWYLCDNLDEMVEKAVMTIEHRDLKPWIKEAAFARFREYFTWENCTRKCYEVFQKVLAGEIQKIPSDKELLKNASKTLSIIMDMTNPSRDPANPGIIRVCRRLAAELQKYMDPIFVIWSEPDKAYVMPTLREYQYMGTYHGPILFDDMRLSPDAYRIMLTEYLARRTPKKVRWMFLPDIIFMDQGYDVKTYCGKNRFFMADIFYDDIPYKLKDIYSKKRQDEHAGYMMRLADSVFVSSISRYSTACITEFFQKVGITNANVKTIELSGEFNSVERQTKMEVPDTEIVQFLCVSTLEPRKNHKVLIDACFLLEKEHPDLNFRLVMIGNKYPGHFDIADYAEHAMKKTDKIRWLGIASDEVLKEEIKKSSFTVYLSKMEGYGMPIMESIWQGKPCLCSEEGAMGELAAGGGCYTTNVCQVKEVAAALYELCTDRRLIERLTKEAVSREIITWEQYAGQTLETFVLEECRILGNPMPDQKYSATDKEIYMPLMSQEQAAAMALLQKKPGTVSVVLGISDTDMLKAIDRNSDLTVVFCSSQMGLHMRYQNLIYLTEGIKKQGKILTTYENERKLLQFYCFADLADAEMEDIEFAAGSGKFEKMILFHAKTAKQLTGYTCRSLGKEIILYER